MKPCNYDSRPHYERLIEPLRARARELGYAIAVHGTLKRDIDLVAIPWTPEAVDAHELAEAVRQVAEGITGWARPKIGLEDSEYFKQGSRGSKPHGRLVWTFHLEEKWQGGGGPYIDLSVMPRLTDDDLWNMPHRHRCPGCGERRSHVARDCWPLAEAFCDNCRVEKREEIR